MTAQGGIPIPSAFPAGRLYRGLLLDIGRKPFTVDGVLALLERLASHRFTALHLHVAETPRLGVALPGFEHLAAGDAWSAQDARRVAAAAAHHGIAIVPEADIPSHMAALLRERPELWLRDRTGEVHRDRLDLAHPDALSFALSVLDALFETFPGDAVHLGGDEFFAAPWESAQAQRPDRFPSLVSAAMERFGPRAGALDLFAAFMNTLADHARSAGRTPIMWNDHVVPAAQSPVVAISTDTVIEVWIRWRSSTPSVADYLASGYRVINAHGDQLYAVLGGRGDVPRPHGERRFGRLADTFRPRRFMGLAAQDVHIDVPRPAPGLADPVLGASMSVWCDDPASMSEQDLWPVLETWFTPFARAMDDEQAELGRR